ncbi:hypothetical protein GYMLUDRAFT_251039 [Collybiopsis luxurians FD-317 M1]|uniref:Ribonuclease H1 N-terminal domain-containing protein n=1 Tax=Collybiopsis luxurians FD-317 M1 TaxID=944289 RepID=A0A0D0CCN0_9AGAR|nr:hypothetical protein GYMLUDRAFT_251039 [Collybiopsis luxurians FD-317 M1]
MALSSSPTVTLPVAEVSFMLSALHYIQMKLLNITASEKENCEAWVPPPASDQDTSEPYDFSCTQVSADIGGNENKTAEHAWDPALSLSSQWDQTLSQHPGFKTGLISNRNTEGQSEAMDPSIPTMFTVSESDLDSVLVPPPPPTPVTGIPNQDNRWYVVTVGRAVGVFSSLSLAHMLVYRVKGSVMQSFRSYSEATGEFELAKALGLVKVVHGDA